MLITAHCNRLRLAGFRPRTVECREQVLRAFADTLGGRQLPDATRLDVEAYLARDLAAETRRAYLGHIRGWYAWALEEEYAASDPTIKLPAIRVARGVPRPINVEHLRRAVLAADSRQRAWLLLMALGGLRCMEVAGLRPQDLLEQDGGVLLYLDVTKGGGSGTVPAHPEILAALRDVPIRNGLWWDCSPRHVSVTTNTYLRSLGITSTAHALRHYSGTSWLTASGFDLLTTSRLMRHKSMESTVIYTQLSQARPAEVVNLVPHLLAG